MIRSNQPHYKLARQKRALERRKKEAAEAKDDFKKEVANIEVAILEAKTKVG